MTGEQEAEKTFETGAEAKNFAVPEDNEQIQDQDASTNADSGNSVDDISILRAKRAILRQQHHEASSVKYDSSSRDARSTTATSANSLSVDADASAMTWREKRAVQRSLDDIDDDDIEGFDGARQRDYEALDQPGAIAIAGHDEDGEMTLVEDDSQNQPSSESETMRSAGTGDDTATLTPKAMVVDDKDLEAEYEDRLIAKAVVAEVVEEKRQPRTNRMLLCILLLAFVVVGAVVGVVL
ncbi:MAG: hypothetical protein SGILL_003679, partial [Bacillariaceae sp.]